VRSARGSTMALGEERPMRYGWIAFKFLLSLVLVIAAIVVGFGALVSDRWLDPMAFASLAVFLFLAALPWAYPFKKSSRAAGLMCIFLSALCAVLAYQVWFGSLDLPEDCSRYRAKLGCHIVNAIYGVSGRPGVAALWAGVAGLLLWGARKFIKGSRRQRA
jgi:hypothetical protein